MTAPLSGLVLAVLVVTAWIGAELGVAALDRHRAAAAADLAALAAAQVLLQGEELACRRAGQVARANGAVLLRCLPEGTSVLVQVRGRRRGDDAPPVRSSRAGLVSAPPALVHPGARR